MKPGHVKIQHPYRSTCSTCARRRLILVEVWAYGQCFFRLCRGCR